MNPFAALSKPQYLLRPSQIVRRLLRGLRPHQTTARLAWGMRIEIDPADTVGHALLGQGIYDLVTTELLWRLATPGNRAIDIGANVGYMTCILAWRAGQGGSVLAVEPHPKTFAILEKNAKGWNASGACARVTCLQRAVSDYEGKVRVSPSSGPTDPNLSHASITHDFDSPNGLEVGCWTLVGLLDKAHVFSILKIDTEGHEARILAGAESLLLGGRIQNVVYEEMAEGNADSHDILRACGYTLFAFEERFPGPAIFPWPHVPATRRPYEIRPSYLATREPRRVEQIFSQPGWQSLG